MSNMPHSLVATDEQPAFTPPDGAFDAHFHVFGKKGDYPYAPGIKLRYDPPPVTIEDFRAIAGRLGLKRAVLVQPSCYGFDNSCQLDGVAALGLDSARAVVDIDEEAPDSEFERLHALGGRGVRINVNPIEPHTPGLADRMRPRVQRMAERCKAFGWHLDFLFPDWLTAEFIPDFRQLQVPHTIGHMGMNRAEKGVDAPGFQSLLDLMRHGDGNSWVKLTAAYRISNHPDYDDVVPMAQALIDIAPDRLIWGTDFPHVSFTQHSTVKLFNLVARFAPDEATRKRIMVDNPVKLYDF